MLAGLGRTMRGRNGRPWLVRTGALLRSCTESCAVEPVLRTLVWKNRGRPCPSSAASVSSGLAEALCRTAAKHGSATWPSSRLWIRESSCCLRAPSRLNCSIVSGNGNQRAGYQARTESPWSETAARGRCGITGMSLVTICESNHLPSAPSQYAVRDGVNEGCTVCKIYRIYSEHSSCPNRWDASFA
jgi:hypothetical protein